MELAGRTLTVEIGKVAAQANGAALMRYGDTVVLSTATASEKPREGIDFFPLSVEFEEKMYAVGKIPGGFNKREGKASEHAVLTSRVIDRPMRPLFPKDYRNDVTLNNLVMAVDPDCSPEVTAMLGASVATSISDIPFDGPIAGTRIGLIDGEFIVNPTADQQLVSDLALTVASTAEKVIMIEAGANEVPEDKMIEAIFKAHEVNKEVIKFIDRIVEECGKEKHEYEHVDTPEDLWDDMVSFITPEAMEELCRLISSFINKTRVNTEKILNISINISGRVNPESGYSFSQFNFSEQPLAEVLTEKIGYPVCIDNDTRAMTYGEYLQGCVKGEKNIIFVNISWGIGIGIIIDGKVYTGKSGFSGEFGHVNVFDNETLCHCGKKGCLETEASGSALHRILLERIRNGESSILSNRVGTKENPLTLDEIIAAVNKEDLLCIEIVEEIGQKLGKQIAGLINIFNPELVIIGGTLSLTGDYITQPIKTAVRKYSLNLVNKDSVIMTSKLKDKAGIVGACMLARSRMFES